MNIKKYTLAVYLLLATLSIILMLISLNYLDEYSSTQALFLNLATEIAGAVLIFFVVNRIFSIDEREDGQELRLLRKEIQEQFSPFSIASSKNSSVSFIRDNISIASHIDIVSYSRVILLRQNRDILIEAIKQGVKIRLIIVDINNKAGEIMLENARTAESVITNHSNVLRYIREIKQSVATVSPKTGAFEAKLTNWIPSCSVVLIHSPKAYLSKARVAIYPLAFRFTGSRRRILMLDGGRYPEHIDYFSEQIETLWEHDTYDINTRNLDS